MITENSKRTEDAQIRQLINSRVKAMQDKDINGLMSNYSPEVVEFDAVNPLRYNGINETRKRAEEWFGAYKGPIGYEVRDLSITTGNDVAFCHFPYHISGIMTNGSEVDMWVRDTICYRKIDGNWMITHEHTSVPFEVESGKASLALKP